MDLRALNAGLAALLTAFLGIYPLFTRRDTLTRLFAASNISLAIWDLGDTVGILPLNSHFGRLLFFRANYIASIFVVWFFYRFILEFAKINIQKGKVIWNALLVIGLVLIPLSLTQYLIVDLKDTVRPFEEIPGQAYPLFVLFMGGGLGFALYRLFATYRTAIGKEKTKIKYMFIALFFLFLQAIYYLVSIYGANISPYYFYFQVIYSLVVAYAIQAHQLLDLKLLTRDAVIKTSALFLVVLPLLIARMFAATLLTFGGGGLLRQNMLVFIVSVLNFALVAALLREHKNRHARVLAEFFFLLGLWNLGEFLLVYPQNFLSVWLYRFTYGIGCFVVLTWMRYWDGIFEAPFTKPRVILSKVMRVSAYLISALSILTPFVLSTLTFDVRGTMPAVEVPGPAFGLYVTWFLLVICVSAYLLIHNAFLVGVENTFQKGRKWIFLSFALAAAASGSYFLFTSHYLPIPIHGVLEIFLCVCMVNAYFQHDESYRQSSPMRFGRFLIVLAIPVVAGFLLAGGAWIQIVAGTLIILAVPRLLSDIEESVRLWVDDAWFQDLRYIPDWERLAKKKWNLSSLEDALPEVARDIITTAPYRSCTAIIIFLNQTLRPRFRATQIRTLQGDVIEGSPWSEELDLAFLQFVREKGRLVLREDEEDLPPLIRDVDGLLFEAAVPVKLEGEIVGVIVLGPKEGKSPFMHHKDLEILQTLGTTVSERLAPSVEINLFRTTVNNTIHDGGNYLRIVLGKLELKEPLNDEDVRTLKKHRDVLRELRAMAQNELSKGQRPEQNPIDMEVLLKEAYSSYRSEVEKKGLSFTLNLIPPIPRVRKDPLLIDRCIANLISNAIKYTPQGKIEVTAQAQDEFVLVSVKDSGLGIPSESVNKIFESGYRVPGKAATIAEGTGIGLANVQELMVAMGGKVQVESQLGVGSCFSLWFPVSKEDLAISQVA